MKTSHLPHLLRLTAPDAVIDLLSLANGAPQKQRIPAILEGDTSSPHHAAKWNIGTFEVLTMSLERRQYTFAL